MTTTVTFDGGFLRIHDHQIDRFGMTGGQLWNLVDDVVGVAHKAAIAGAPIRYGILKTGIRRRRPVYNAATKTATAYFTSTAPHSQYVIFGTGPVITANGGGYMRLKPWAGGGYFGPTFRKVVRGQRANDFMTPALRAGMASQGL